MLDMAEHRPAALAIGVVLNWLLGLAVLGLEVLLTMWAVNASGSDVDPEWRTTLDAGSVAALVLSLAFAVLVLVGATGTWRLSRTAWWLTVGLDALAIVVLTWALGTTMIRTGSDDLRVWFIPLPWVGALVPLVWPSTRAAVLRNSV
jgi:hypothetical protein